MSHSEDNAQNLLPIDGDDEYEVITSEEVDQVLDQLDQMIQSVESDNVRSILEEAADQIYCLIYSDDEEESQESEAA